MIRLPKSIFIAILFIVVFNNVGKAQDFFEDYARYIKHTTTKDSRQSYIKSLDVMKKAFDESQKKSNISILARDTIFIVQISFPVSFRSEVLVWNRSTSLVYTYSFNLLVKPSQIGKYGTHGPIQPFKVDIDASNKINHFTSEFKRWVETADTISYGKDGLGGAIDAPFTRFVVAIKTTKHWTFISSKTTKNNIYKESQ